MTAHPSPPFFVRLLVLLGLWAVAGIFVVYFSDVTWEAGDKQDSTRIFIALLFPFLVPAFLAYAIAGEAHPYLFYTLFIPLIMAVLALAEFSVTRKYRRSFWIGMTIQLAICIVTTLFAFYIYHDLAMHTGG